MNKGKRFSGKILYILKHNPWGIGGGCYACRNYFDAFCSIFDGARIDVCICQEYLKDKETEVSHGNIHYIGVKPRNLASKLSTPITGVLHRHQSITRELIMKSDYDYCIFDHNSIAGSLVGVCKKRDIKTIVLNHNCEYEYFKDNNPGKLKQWLLLPQVEKNERVSYRECDYNIFLTEEDKELFEKRYGKSTTQAIVSGCFLRKGDQVDKENIVPFNKEKPRMVISGTLGNVQNLDGIYYFLNELYPYIPDGMEVVITGKNHPASLTEIIKSLPNVTLIPNPVNILEIVRKYDIFLCPTRLGGGMKLRIMDGLRCGLPVIAHKVSARGYRAFEKKHYLYSFETSEDFSKALSESVTQIRNGDIEKRNIVEMFQQHFSFEKRLRIIRLLLAQSEEIA